MCVSVVCVSGLVSVLVSVISGLVSVLIVSVVSGLVVICVVCVSGLVSVEGIRKRIRNSSIRYSGRINSKSIRK
ncbi:hypothetical protein LUQ84_000319 [Hamiltosporidium tvaerminnensis]|nr:hypothetical protein LUQ84_000319 [Hamiltosporidium tvaerminnensis]